MEENNIEKRKPKSRAIKSIHDLTPEHWVFIREYSASGSRERCYRLAYPEQVEHMSVEEIRNASKQLEVNAVVKEQISIYQNMHNSEAKIKYNKILTKAGVQKENMILELSAMKDIAIAERNHNAVVKYCHILNQMLGHYEVDKKVESDKKKITFGGWSPAEFAEPVKIIDKAKDQNQNNVEPINDTGE